ncbi:thiamine pyrophosphate-dependent dehydrogenase E1 component subunit alpha [Marinicrinis sediminis]|uniref:2-oxoisovalerate dehydrogenase subunit alpha n=1 Tax=Marinicrinis sediminis TaxID=1652465 RepID=A0ABW5RDB5_9BACL
MEQTSSAEQFRHHAFGLTNEEAVDMYRWMQLGRKYDEWGLILQRAGKINFHIAGPGQEAAQVGAAFALEKDTDYILPYYRDFAFVLKMGMTMKELMLSLFAKAEDPNSGGRQMPGHFGSKRLKMVTGSSPVTTQVPHAVGIALAAKMRKEELITFVTFGEGSSNQGDFHEGLNFAGVHRLPVIFMCENNRYAISVPYHKQVGAESIADRAKGYGFPGIQVDGNDPLAMYQAVKEARERAIRGEGPTLIEACCYRFSPHSTSDNDLAYRTQEEVDYHKEKDGVRHFRNYLVECGLWSEEQEIELGKEADQLIREAIRYAEEAPFPKPEDTLLHVYASSDQQNGEGL